MQKAKKVPEGSSGYVFETSWEVCNKVGGIYTVLSTKANVLKAKLGDRLIFIGPDLSGEDGCLPGDFIERPTVLGHAYGRLKLPDGITIRTGRWRVPGLPFVVLVGFDGIRPRMNEIYGEMWRQYGVDSLHAYGDYDESCAFAVASAIVIEALSRHLRVEPSDVTAHFDEWTTGMGLLYLKSIMPLAATVFTTHATSIGRSICGNGKPLYDYFNNYDGDQMARELNMESKHSLEKAAAHQADCFTAVSELTARECAQLLGIRPQVVTPNGFEPDFVPGNSKFAMLRSEGRARLLRIASILKGKNFDADTLIIATSGRNEYRNKGLDLYLDSLVKAQNGLPDGRQVLALALVPGWISEPSADLAFDLGYNGNVKPDPDYMTHRLHNEDSDPLCCRIRQLESEGALHKIDVIDVPCYLDGHDGVVDKIYYDLLPAVDITVFASYYEPWGYTPLESAAFGIPTVTTDKSGFGQWVKAESGAGFETSGVEVVDRTDSNYWQAASDIADVIGRFASLRPQSADKIRRAAKATARKADWQFFIRYYDEAFEYARKERDVRTGIVSAPINGVDVSEGDRSANVRTTSKKRDVGTVSLRKTSKKTATK